MASCDFMEYSSFCLHFLPNNSCLTNYLQKSGKNVTMNQKGSEMKKRRLSIFQSTAIILTVLLFVFIIVSIGIIIDLRNKTNQLKEKNDEITQSVATNYLIEFNF